MKLFVYRRVSKEDFESRKAGLEQGGNHEAMRTHSLQTQLSRGANYCELHGHELGEVFTDDGVSASVPLIKRPEGKRMLRALFAGEADGFVVQYVDRGFRVTLDGLLTLEKFNRRGLTIHSAMEHIDTSTASGRFMFRQLLSNAEYERDRISERCIEITGELQRTGKPWGHIPYGCIERDGQVYRDPAFWGIRERIVGMKASGHSYGSIIKRLHKDGITTPGGDGTWWGKSTLHGIVKTHHTLKDIPVLAGRPDARDSDQLERK